MSGSQTERSPMVTATCNSRRHGTLSRPTTLRLAAHRRQGRGPAAAQLRRWRHPLSLSGDILAIGWLANQVRERMHGDIYLLQRQSAHQPHQCLRRLLPSLRVRTEEGRARDLHHGPRRGVGDGSLRLHRGRNRVPHRRRPASRPPLRILHGPRPRPQESAFPRSTSRPSPWSR